MGTGPDLANLENMLDIPDKHLEQLRRIAAYKWFSAFVAEELADLAETARPEILARAEILAEWESLTQAVRRSDQSHSPFSGERLLDAVTRLEQRLGQVRATTGEATPAADEAREEYFENQATGVELEDESTSPDEPKPWDPDKIRILTKHYSLRHLIDMIAEGDLDLAPDFQRRLVWKPRQRWNLIESLLLGIPLPSFYLNENISGRLQVVDGVQRLTTIFDFVYRKAFALGSLGYLHEMEGRKFDDLKAMFRRRLQNAQFVAHVIDPQTPYQVKFEIFRRINTGGNALNGQEIRHCMSDNRSRTFLKELAAEESFSAATGGVLRDHPRMADREVVLRFVGFRMFTPEEYAEHGTFDEFLGAVTRRLDDPAYEDLDQLRADFISGMTNCRHVFGEYAFRKRPRGVDRRNPINRALFETWGTVLADYAVPAVRAGANELLSKARDLMTDDLAFIDAISGSTGDARRVRTRFDKVRDTVREVLA